MMLMVTILAVLHTKLSYQSHRKSVRGSYAILLIGIFRSTSCLIILSSSDGRRTNKALPAFSKRAVRPTLVI